VVPPDTVNGFELPEHIAVDGETAKIGGFVTLTVTTALEVQVPVAPITV
jgi:hypothetical protein